MEFTQIDKMVGINKSDTYKLAKISSLVEIIMDTLGLDEDEARAFYDINHVVLDQEVRHDHVIATIKRLNNAKN